MKDVTQKILVWDLPVRVFHWLLAAGFLGSYFIASSLGEDSAAFPYHAMLGMTLALMVLLRLLWGIIGTRWAKFSRLHLRPTELLDYFRGVFSSKGKAYIGHNPATSWTMLAILILILALAWTGYQTAAGTGSETIHGLFANAMLALVAFHVIGVIVHAVRKQDGIVLGMIHGHKSGEPADAVKSPQVFAGLAFLALIGFFFGSLATSFDPASQSTKWPIFGTRLPLGESEQEGGSPGALKPDSETEENEQD